VGTKVQAQILGGGRTHAATCIMFDRKSRATFDPGAACTVVWWSRKMFSGMIRLPGSN
jgi:hypothetical protein